MKVCMLAAERGISDARMFYKEAMSLREKYGKGEVCVVCRHEKAYEEIEGIAVHGLSLSARKPALLWEMYRAGKKTRAEVFHAHDPSAAYVAWKLKGRLGSHALYDYPGAIALDFFSNARINALAEGVARRWEKRIARHMDGIIVSSGQGMDYFGDRASVTRVDRWPSLRDFPERERPMNAPPLLVYEGILDFHHALRELMEALHILKQRGVRFRFRLIGSVPEAERPWLEEYLRLHELGEVFEDRGWVEYRGLGEELCAGDVGLLTLRGAREACHPLPGKLYDYMRYGMAVAAAHLPEVAGILSETACGLCFDSEDAQDIANKLQAFLEDPSMREQMGQRGKAAVLGKYNWEEAEKGFLAAYEGLRSLRSGATRRL